jgi:capsular polysaccharide transport system permease protein
MKDDTPPTPAEEAAAPVAPSAAVPEDDEAGDDSAESRERRREARRAARQAARAAGAAEPPAPPPAASEPPAPAATPAPAAAPAPTPAPAEPDAAATAAAVAALAAARAARLEARAGAREARREAPPGMVVRPTAPAARLRRRHRGLALAFLLMVALPTFAAGWYLYARAADQYASTLGFTVRSEDISSAVDFLGGLGATLGGGGSHDADVLYEFVRSQELVAKIDGRLDLRSLYSRHLDTDPLLGFDPRGTIEDLTSYWGWMVRVSYDSGSGLMELRVLAFDPADARAIADAIYEECTRRINELSEIAREDATRYARLELDQSVEQLKAAREALTQFRLASQIVDPSADIQGQMGLLNTLQAQLAEALIELDLLTGTTREGDPRITQAQRRIEVIEARIAEERKKFGAGGSGPGGENYATTVAEFERLSVEQQFAEQAYTAARSAYDGAIAEANRQSRYLAAYIRPTLAERSEFPQRELMTGLVFVFGFLAWAIASLVYYSLRDRR